jgi:hypothetical protein
MKEADELVKSILDFKQIVEAESMAYVRSAWLQIAAVAWLHYQIEGKGVIIMGLDQPLMVGEQTAKTSMQYLAKSSPVLQAIGARIGWKEVEDYDPAKEIWLLLLLLDGDLIIRKVSFADLPTPPEAHRIMGSMTPVAAVQH